MPIRSDEGDRRPRSDCLSNALALASAIVICGAFLGERFWVAGAALLIAGGALGRLRSPDAAALALGTAAFAAATVVPALTRIVPAPLVIALAVVFVASRFRAPWMARGEISAAVGSWIIAMAALAGVGLVAWWVLARPDVSDLTLRSDLRQLAARPSLLVAAVVGWSALNAAAEELFFRGALQLGALRLRSSGLLAPWLAHVAADVVVAMILLSLVT